MKPVLTLIPAILSDNFRKKWNVHENDFYYLAKNGKLDNNLYRIGGIGSRNINPNDKYFILLKQVKSEYSDEITKIKKRKLHLADCHCIIDSNGNEKRVFPDGFYYPSLCKNSVVYYYNTEYFNIETNESYCKSSTKMETSEFIFLNNEYDSDKSRRGVMKINKNDGTYEFFREK